MIILLICFEIGIVLIMQFIVQGTLLNFLKKLDHPTHQVNSLTVSDIVSRGDTAFKLVNFFDVKEVKQLITDYLSLHYIKFGYVCILSILH
jgi:hypothetical protein